MVWRSSRAPGSLRADWRSIERCFSLRLLIRHRMPPAIYGCPTTSDSAILVFAQHAPGPQYLEPKLRHLAENGYEAVTTWEFDQWLAGLWKPQRPSVMLTFDDGLKAFARNTLPLLQTYGFRSVLFVCPGLVDMATAADDLGARLASKTILTWDELRSLSNTGMVDVQSHGMWHNRVAYSASARAGAADRMDTIMQCTDLLPPDGRLERLLSGQGQDVLRLPSIPFFSASHREGIGEQAFVEDLAEARERIESNLPGHHVRAFAFPWYNGSPEAVSAARQAGYSQSYWGLAGIGPLQGREAIDPLRIGRLGFDWIHCLPGKGRTTVRRLLLQKLLGNCDDSR